MAAGLDALTHEYLIHPGFELSFTRSGTIRGSVAGGVTLESVGPLTLATVTAATEPSSTYALVRTVAGRGSWSASTVAETVERLKRESVLVTRDSEAFDQSSRWVSEGWIDSLHYHLSTAGEPAAPRDTARQSDDARSAPPETDSPGYELPAPVDLPERPLSATARERETCREFGGEPLDAEALATVLEHAQVSLDDGGPVHTSSGSRRGCYATYVVVVRSPDVPSGVYEYRADEHALNRVRRLSATPTEIDDRVQDALISQAYARGCSFLLVVTVQYDRVREQFDSAADLRGGFVALSMYAHRYLLTATACGLATFQTGAYHDSEVAALLGLDGFDEQPGFVLAFGREQ